MKRSEIDELELKSSANFFAEYELREKGAVNSEDFFGHLALNKRLYQPRGDYFVYIRELDMPRA